MTFQCRKIVSVNTADEGGGAERMARDLFEGYRRHGRESWLIVGRKAGDDAHVMPFWRSPHLDYRPLDRWWPKTRRRLAKWYGARAGLEDFHFPHSHRLRKITGSLPDLVHLHNLHGGYFDLSAIIQLRKKIPVVWTLHDCWPLTGHCAYPVNCDRWRTGCGRCPDLTLYPAVRRDATARNWRRKQEIFRRTKLHVAAPSRWLLDRLPGSILERAVVESRCIPNGVDLECFSPGCRDAARRELGLPPDEDILLYAAYQAATNPYKDGPTVLRAAERLGAERRSRRLRLVLLGERRAPVVRGGVTVEGLPFEASRSRVAQYYRASDLVLHAANEEAFGLVVVEAMACGRPVVATAVGAIPELFRDGVDGLRVPKGDDAAMAAACRTLLDDPPRRLAMGESASAWARRHYGRERMIGDYLGWFEELVAERRGRERDRARDEGSAPA